MLTRKTLFALAATAALGVSALGTTQASAWGFHGFGYHSHFASHWAFRYHYWHSHVYRPYWSHYHWYRPYLWRYRWIGAYRPYYRTYGYGAIGTAAAPISAGYAQPPVSQPVQPVVQQPPQQPTNCLVKQYMPNGAVVFQDTCTQEIAVSPAQAGGMQGPQGPTGPGGSRM